MATKERKVWAIEQGEYSDYRVIGVFSSRKNAERILDKIGKGGYGPPEIVEWTLDPGINEMNTGLEPYNIRIDYSGQVERCEPGTWNSYDMLTNLWSWKRTTAPAFMGQNINDAIDGVVFAKDKEHAIKIANDRRVALIASGELQSCE